MRTLELILIGKAARVFVFGLVSVLMPVYVAILGYSPPLVGIAISAMAAGNAVSNVALVKYERRLGRKRLLILFSFLMMVSGLLLFWIDSSYLLILFACFIGNVSTTGTEAGPFQSVEAGLLPNLVPGGKLNRTFGVYNMIGYGASSIGAIAASLPSFFHDSLWAFRLLYLVYGLTGLLLVALYLAPKELDQADHSGEILTVQNLSPPAKREAIKLSVLFSLDAFGGGLASQSLLVYWFYLVYGVSLINLGVIFFVVNILAAISMFCASLLADRIGNLRTMVYTHAVSNTFLILIPLAGSLVGALSFLFARQSISQMDVPTRQAFMTRVFDDHERVSANAITNTSRTISNVFGSPISGAFLGAGLTSLPLVAAGLSKIIYDALMFSVYRKKAK